MNCLNSRLSLLVFILLATTCQDKADKKYDLFIQSTYDSKDLQWLNSKVVSDKLEDHSESHLISKFDLGKGSSIRIVNLSSKNNNPNVAVISIKPQVLLRKSPTNTLISPLEIYIKLSKNSQPPPKELTRHHLALASIGIIDTIPRLLNFLAWELPSDNIPPEYGPVDLCSSGSSRFYDNWRWFSTFHGAENHYAIEELWTGRSVLTGYSEPRSAAICLPHEDFNGSMPRARYTIQNREGSGYWETIYISGWMGRGEGVGFQTYGPGKGSTRIVVTTQNNDHYFFWAGASWDNYIDWFKKND
jgi:hypothetical protein